MLFVGSFYVNPDLLLDYGEKVIPKYDFAFDTSKFLFNSIYELYQYQANDKITEVKINIFMNQDEERKEKYKKLGGYKYIERVMKLIDLNEIENYYNNLKKYSLLRELERKGFPAQKIFEKNNFSKVTPEDIIKGMEYQISTIGTVIGGIEDSIILGKDMPEVYEQWKTSPDMGIQLPFRIISELIRGWRKGKLNFLGLHSGCGKSRITSFIVAFIGIYLQEKILVAVNEQFKDEWDAMILSAVVNNPIFGFGNCSVDEGNIVTGTCSPAEDALCKKAAKWISENSQIHWILLKEYGHNDIKRQVKRHKIRGCDYFVYDTLKSPDLDWQSFVKTGRMLKEVAVDLDVGVWATFQLTDDSLFDEILTSKAIANGKHIKHEADGLFMARPLSRNEYDKYQIMNPYGFTDTIEYYDLSPSYQYYGWWMDKNRGGGDKDVLAIRADKGKNFWLEEGFLIESSLQKELRKLKKEVKKVDMQEKVAKYKKKVEAE